MSSSGFSCHFFVRGLENPIIIVAGGRFETLPVKNIHFPYHLRIAQGLGLKIRQAPSRAGPGIFVGKEKGRKGRLVDIQGPGGVLYGISPRVVFV